MLLKKKKTQKPYIVRVKSRLNPPSLFLTRKQSLEQAHKTPSLATL